jgi:hypothetical protein
LALGLNPNPVVADQPEPTDNGEDQELPNEQMRAVAE